MTTTKQNIISALRRFISQRSGIDYRNYASGDYQASREAFMGDYRPILRNGKYARQMLRYIELRDSITADDIITAAHRAFSGRLQILVQGDAVTINYTTGQYFPTEYRAAACAVLSSVLCDYWREGCGSREHIKKKAKNELGRGIAARWFN